MQFVSALLQCCKMVGHLSMIQFTCQLFYSPPSLALHRSSHLLHTATPKESQSWQSITAKASKKTSDIGINLEEAGEEKILR